MFKTLRNYEMKHFGFGIMGGFYFSHHFEGWMKHSWICLNLICFIINMGTCIGYLAVMRDVDLSTTYYSLCLMDGTLYSTVFVPCVTYYFRHELDIIFQLNKDVQPEGNVQKLKQKITRVICCMLILIPSVFLLHIGFLFFVSNLEEYLMDVRSYNIPTPWVKKLETKWLYIWNSLFYFLPVVLMFSSSAACSFFVLLISGEFYFSASTLCKRIASFSGSSWDVFEGLTEQSSKPSAGNKFRYFSQEMEVEREKLLENMRTAIQDFQLLVRKIKFTKRYIEFHFTISIIFTLVAELFLISTLYSHNMNNLQKMRGALELIVINLGWLCFTYAGKVFDDMGDMIRDQIYNIPWIYLDPSRRKTFYIFLYLVQRPISFHGFGTYVMGMPFFLQTTKLAYTYSNFLRNVSKN